MIEQEIKVPSGIRYLSQWTDFGQQLPYCHFILNKVHTGIGATQYFLSCNERVILCTPRCSLIENKRNKHPTACFYRYMDDNVSTDESGKKIKAKKKASFEDIKKYNAEVMDYVKTCYSKRIVPKVMVTYDSLGHVMDALRSVGEDLGTWTLVIDEFQVIFSDSAFKSLTEMLFLKNAQAFTKVIYLSATPYLKEYMEQMNEFKNLPYYTLVWPKEMEKKAIVTNVIIKKGNSRVKICQDLINKMRKGQTVKFGDKEFDTNEAVFYINNVNDILKIVEKCSLTSDEVNILCSKSNGDRLKKAGLSLGTFPKEGEHHKMFTFCTKSVYLGVDFYSDCAMSYVFADPSQDTLALDISMDLTQILGRQRLDRNPYQNEAVLFIKESFLQKKDEEFSAYVEKKKEATESLITAFHSADPDTQEASIPVYRSSMKNDCYKNNYLMVIDDPTTEKPTVAFNTLYMLAEIRAWQISTMNLKNMYSIISEQDKVGIIGTIGTTSENPDVWAFKAKFEATRDTTQRLKLYCDFRQLHPDLVSEIDFISGKYADYWDALGYEDLKSLGFQESKIRLALAEPTPFDSTLEAAILEVRENLKERRYTANEVKAIIKAVYKKTGLKKGAKDIGSYVTAKEVQDGKTGKRYYEIHSCYQKSITMFPFVWRPNVPMSMTIDRLLDIIETGKYTIKKSDTESQELRDVIDEIRSTPDHDAQAKLKRDWLPVVCVNGRFKYKGDHGLDCYSSFVALDFDGFKTKEEMSKTKELLKTFEWVYAVFKTPSGMGLKAIVLHDSVNPSNHWNLMKQLMNELSIPENDDVVVDLSRGHFLSYDSNLWHNPNPKAYHFVFDGALDKPTGTKSKERFVSVSDFGDTKLDIWTAGFLNDLRKNLLTDDAILERLDKHWKKEKPEYFEVGNRHRSMLIIAGTLCKAGIPKEKTTGYLIEAYPQKDQPEIDSIVEFAYENNAFGCDRRRYRR